MNRDRFRLFKQMSSCRVSMDCVTTLPGHRTVGNGNQQAFGQLNVSSVLVSLEGLHCSRKHTDVYRTWWANVNGKHEGREHTALMWSEASWLSLTSGTSIIAHLFPVLSDFCLVKHARTYTYTHARMHTHTLRHAHAHATHTCMSFVYHVSVAGVLDTL